MPEGYSFLQAHGKWRVVGSLIQKPPEPPRTIVIHLDYPGVSMVFEVSSAYTAEVDPTASGISSFVPVTSFNTVWFPSPIYGASASRPKAW